MWGLKTRQGRIVAIAHLPATAGSASDADVHLPHASIAPRHARFLAGPEDSLVVEALGDAVVGVARKRVRRGLLHDGDELVLGKLPFTVVANNPSASRTRPVRADPQPVPAGSGSLVQRRPSGRRKAPAREPAGEPVLRVKSLPPRRRDVRRGLLHADLAQVSAGMKALLFVGIAALCWGLIYGVSWLTELLG